MTSLTTPPSTDFLDAVLSGLSAQPKSLPCRFFYDLEGSLLFERICDLPEYYLTRTEDAILRARADEIAACLPQRVDVVELGSGSSRKTRRLLEALLRRGEPLRYLPVDISAAMLEQTAGELRRDYPALHVEPLAMEYGNALTRLSAPSRRSRLFLFLGSSLGNFSPEDGTAFLRSICAAMHPGDALLLGLDLQKAPELLNAAYDDAEGVTARFNLNLLRRINRELGGDFDLSRFRHCAFYNAQHGRVEMHLLSREPQTVTLAGNRFLLASGESIHTENSYKYTLLQIAQMAQEAELEVLRSWRDPAEWFSLTLLGPA